MDRRKYAAWKWPMIGIMLAAAFLGGNAPSAVAATGVNLVMDGQTIVASPAPVIIDGRTLVPVRLVSESLGALVEWDATSKAVSINRGGQQVKLRIDNRLVDYQGQDLRVELIDVAPRILDDRTFVPLRWVATALGVGVRWDGNQRTVYINSGQPGDPPVASRVAFSGIQPNQVISGTTDLRLAMTGQLHAPAAAVRFVLLDPESGRGPVVARGSSLAADYRLVPNPSQNGNRLLAAAVYGGDGNWLAGTVMPVTVAVKPQVVLQGIAAGQKVEKSLTLAVAVNFVTEYVNYELTNQATGLITKIDKVDPYGSYTWVPMLPQNGDYLVRAKAYDLLGQVYVSPAIPVTVNVSRQLTLKGVASAATITNPVTLSLARNFDFSKVQFLLKDLNTNQETVIANLDNSTSYRWFPAPEKSGKYELQAVVVDGQGQNYRSNSIPVTVQASPALYLDSVGPNQVLAGSVKLQSLSNVPLAKIEYLLVDAKGNQRIIASGSEAPVAYSWTPKTGDAGKWQLRARGVDAAGQQVMSQTLPVQVYIGTIHGPQPVVEKNQFQTFASELAVRSQTSTGMSAALQTAQAILETGWGQSVPVDKYSGQFSNNLFGIKGKGSAGSITSNTWEEYNGQTFRIDAAFRAYTNPAEGWDDHKRLLLTSDRYEPFRAVMHDGIQGAWALKRAGYATDSQYPLKLIDIIKRYQLDRLDEVNM